MSVAWNCESTERTSTELPTDLLKAVDMLVKEFNAEYAGARMAMERETEANLEGKPHTSRNYRLAVSSAYEGLTRAITHTSEWGGITLDWASIAGAVTSYRPGPLWAILHGRHLLAQAKRK